MAEQRQSIRRRRLSAELKRARQDASMTVEDVANATEWSMGKISNIETGVRLRPTVMEIKGLLDIYGVTDERRREAVLDLTRQARERGWWSKYSDIFTDDFPAFEAEARSIHTYELAIIPGLLQSPGYVELMMRALLRRNPLDIDRVLETRKRRQAILDRANSPELWAVIDEAALLRFRSAEEAFREQVQHLIDVAEADNTVTIQVLPFASGMHAGVRGPFVVLDFAEFVNPVVYLETDTDGLYLEEPEEVDRYRRLFDHVRTSARYPDASLQMLKDLL
ncbi:transcriptional regulator with XRE-family HTH domain [Spinactinospora alkalitolerans]|uniref:Transcriptional regulator with XRE-family HTH domain n=1 Tax=Spinactinospora alkalitolerans TaxID=687207 RepID=A0A852U9V7_9ACTN|nr:helix-turn-helix transcriptional regulator [Spinactinospora alkalitolerans]NYE50894.1 transcriptional regulator with XRE-family HTH domain [Spinactinospora alkalitolerans]